MKVVCIRECDFKIFVIKVGEILEVEDIYTLTYKFYRNGSRQWTWKDRFITMGEWRERKIKKILDN